MCAVTATFVLKPDCQNKFLSLLVKNAHASKDLEPSCRPFDICLSDDGGRVFLYEIYGDARAFQDHLVSEHFQSFDAAVTDMIEDKSVHQFDRAIQ